jgi:hypothetical protein
MATASKTMTGFGVICPECTNPDGTVRLNLNDLSECSCSECDWEGSPAEAVEMMAERLEAWRAVVRWVELAPAAVAVG